MTKQNRISQPKYISIKPDVLAMADRLTHKLHVNFSQLVTRLIVESHGKVFAAAPKPQEPQGEVDPLS